MRTFLVIVVMLACSAGQAFAQVDAGPGADAAPEADAAPAAEPEEVTPPSFEEVTSWHDELPDFDELRTPDSPAFVILGLSPSEIQKPNTPKAAALSLAAFVSDDDDLEIPRNLAVEIAPFWLFPHDDLTVKDYASSWRSVYRMFTVSVGSATSTDDVTETTTTLLGLGARTRLLLDGHIDQGKLDGCVASLQDLAESDLLPDALLQKIVKDCESDTNPAACFTKAYEEARKERKANGEIVEKQCVDLAGAHQGWLLDAAWAGRWDALQGDAQTNAALDEAVFTHHAAWLTLALASPRAAGSVLLRYATRKVGEGTDQEDWQEMADAGLSTTVMQSRFAGSAEVVVRRRFDAEDGEKEWFYRLALVVEYKLFAETWVTVSMGKDFADGEGGSLFSTANLSWSFGEPQLKK
jgi:hypothetical protein